MIKEGAPVRLRPGSAIARQHAGLVDVVGTVGAIIEGRRRHRFDASDAERQSDQSAHVRFRQPPVVVMSVPIGDLEPADHVDPVRA